MDDGELRELIATNLKYSYADESWVCPLREALEGLDAEQAAWRPPSEGAMGVWDIVLHVARWNRNIVWRIETGEKDDGGEAWPGLPSHLGDAEWESAQAELWESIAALERVVAEVPIEKILGSPYGLADLLCRFTHMAYHSGQIVKLRECMGW